TLQEVKGDLKGRHLAYVGDGNNVAHSLLEGGAKLGVHVTIVTPPGFTPQAAVVDSCRLAARDTGARIQVTTDLGAVQGADAVYTDVWASMGQEAEMEARKRAFAPYQVNGALMAKAGPDAIFLQCPGAH